MAMCKSSQCFPALAVLWKAAVLQLRPRHRSSKPETKRVADTRVKSHIPTYPHTTQ